MPTLERLFKSKREGAYVAPVCVKVCAVAEEKTYTNTNDKEKKYVIMGIADKTMSAKCILYDMSKLKDLREGNSVMLLNIIVKDGNSITLTLKLRVSGIRNMEVSNQKETAAKEIAFPPKAAEVPLRNVEKSPNKEMLSVRGQIVAVPTSTTLNQDMIAFNIEDASYISIVVDDGELYPAYKVQSSTMAKFLQCDIKKVEENRQIALSSIHEP